MSNMSDIQFARDAQGQLASRVGGKAMHYLEEVPHEVDLGENPTFWTERKVDKRVPTAERNQHREHWGLEPSLKRNN